MYFSKPGPANTEQTARLALKTALSRNIKHIVVASNTGDSVLPLIKGADGIKIICVTHADGFAENGKNEMSAQTRARLEADGVTVLTATHVLSGVERGISRKVGGMYPAEIMAYTLRMFGAGVKVCVETAIMALDAGAVPFGDKIIAIGGTGRGADTAVILSPAHANAVFDTYIHEIICKPE
ncbi:MAG: hypothetical protein LBV27_07965 [Oscillospiraceae bacterium]|jgi:hypothetical protein|nr:hypothetical protein [Oscillospiraceae bacterium]